MYRPKMHFTPETGWMNDPNGLIYENGRYHLFYQYYPHDVVWGPMHWGHAVSEDLTHWEHLPIALYPDHNGLAFSGSAVLHEGKIALVYTSHGKTEQQSVAFSEDNVHFTPYEGNPVIPNTTLPDFRDPKAFADPAGGYSLILAAGDRAMFYHSADLIHWDKTGEFGPFALFDDCVWECPCLQPVGDKWVLITSIGKVEDKPLHDMYYWIGRWENGTFTAETEPEIVDFGRDDYAGVTFANAPQPTFLAWASQWSYANQVPTAQEGFRSQMTFARELALVHTPAGLKLAARPLGDLDPVAQVCQEGPFTLTFTNGEETFRVGVDEDNQVFMDRTGLKKADWSERYDLPQYALCRAPRFQNGPCSLSVYMDRSVVEVYADEGTRVGTMLVYAENEMKLKH